MKSFVWLIPNLIIIYKGFAQQVTTSKHCYVRNLKDSSIKYKFGYGYRSIIVYRVELEF